MTFEIDEIFREAFRGELSGMPEIPDDVPPVVSSDLRAAALEIIGQSIGDLPPAAPGPGAPKRENPEGRRPEPRSSGPPQPVLIFGGLEN